MDVARSAFRKWFMFFAPIARTSAPIQRQPIGAFGLGTPRPWTRVKWYFAPQCSLPFPFAHIWGSTAFLDDSEKADTVYGEYPYEQRWWNGATPIGATGQDYCGTVADFTVPRPWPNTVGVSPRTVGGLLAACNVPGQQIQVALDSYSGILIATGAWGAAVNGEDYTNGPIPPDFPVGTKIFFELLGSGGAGGVGGDGGGAAYANKTYIVQEGDVFTYQVADGITLDDTFIEVTNGATTTTIALAVHGQPGTAWAGGKGGKASDCIGDCSSSGGNGGNAFLRDSFTGFGGGGGGPGWSGGPGGDGTDGEDGFPGKGGNGPDTGLEFFWTNDGFGGETIGPIYRGEEGNTFNPSTFIPRPGGGGEIRATY